MLSVLQVLLALVAFACAVLADPQRRYRDRWHRLYWNRYPPGRYYGRIDNQTIIVIIEDRRTTTAAPVTVAPTTAAPITTIPTTSAPTTAAPTTSAPTTAAPTTAVPTNPPG